MAHKLLTFFAVVVQSSAQNGVLQGTVESSSGQAIQKAYVTIQQRPPVDRPYGASTETDVSGRYRFSGIPSGIFRICAVVPGSDYLSPCVSMNQPQNVVTIGPGANVTAPPLRLVKGIRILVRVQDATGVLAAAAREPLADRPILSLRVEPPNYPPILMTARDSTPTGRTFEALVPDAPNAKLHIFARKLELAVEGQVLSGRGTTREITPRPGNAPSMDLRINRRRN